MCEVMVRVCVKVCGEEVTHSIDSACCQLSAAL